RGILKASGELVALLDGDDCFLPRHLELLVPAFERAPDVVLAFGDMMRFDHGGEDRGSVLGALREEIAPISTPLGDGGLFVAGPALRRFYLLRSAIVPSACLVSREAMAVSGLFDKTLAYGEDVDFLWRLLGVGRAAWLNQMVGRKRVHGGNASGPARAEWSERQLLRTVAQLLRFGSDHAPEEVRRSSVSWASPCGKRDGSPLVRGGERITSGEGKCGSGREGVRLFRRDTYSVCYAGTCIARLETRAPPSDGAPNWCCSRPSVGPGPDSPGGSGTR
ncbi:MAG: glycosyltransferase, partial [Gemmatimonadetes bacterium]|nr:glycosyltransferase [Gemmatimonadota bacterium]